MPILALLLTLFNYEKTSNKSFSPFWRTIKFNLQQVCIPVGCIPPTCCFWPYPARRQTAQPEGRLPHYVADPPFHVTSDACWEEADPTPGTDRHMWKHYLPATSFEGCKYVAWSIHVCSCLKHVWLVLRSWLFILRRDASTSSYNLCIFSDLNQ